MARYDIGDTAYSSSLNEQIAQYNKIMRAIDTLQRDNGGVPTRAEGEYYLKAIGVCSEIMNLNLSQRAVHAQWQQRKEDCEYELKRVMNYLDPPAPKAAPAKTAAKPAASAASAASKPSAPAASSGASAAASGTRTVSNNSASAAAAPAGGVVTTESGFTTRNACKDVTAETIERWYKAKPSHGFADVTGMEDLKERLVKEAAGMGWDLTDSALKLNSIQSYFFYGPPGSGKTYLIEAFASEMMEKGFKFIRLLGGDIHASLVGVAEKTVQIAFQEAIDNEPCIIFIDEIENVCVTRNNAEGHEKRLTVAFLEAYNLLKESGKRVIFMGATNYPSLVDDAMMDRISLVRIPLPSVENRTAYFARKLKAVPPEDGFSWEEMAERCDNCSYRDLDRVINAILLKIKDSAIETYGVKNEDGSVNVAETDKAVSEAVTSGSLRLTRTLFEEVRGSIRPSDKTKVLAELDAFEKHVNEINS